MPEEFSASTDSAPESTSANAGESTSTATEQTGQTQAADPNVSAALESQIGIEQWLEDKPETPAIPEDDADIEELQKDPALDPARTPGLVEALRTARAQEREHRKQVAELRQQLTQLEKFGGLEGATQMLGPVNELFANPEQGATKFLDTLSQQALPAYKQMVNDILSTEREYIISQLQQAGALPATQSAGQLTAEDWARIPQEFHATAKQVPADQLINWLENGTDESLLYNLGREAKLQQLDTAQRQQAERQWREQSQAAQKQGYEAATQLGEQFTKEHFSRLSKWQPLGPDNEPQNQTIYKMAFEGAQADLLSDPKFSQMYQDAYRLLTEAPMRRMRNESLAADQDERKARQMAAQINTRLGQMLRERVKLLDGVFRDARAYRESQRSNIPQRTEIPGTSSTVGAKGAPPTLTTDGKVNPSWLDNMISSLPGLGARQG